MNNPARRRRVLISAAVALVLAAAVRVLTRADGRPESADLKPSPAAKEACLRGYARAGTAAESSIVDAWRLSDEQGMLPSELTCGALRARNDVPR